MSSLELNKNPRHLTKAVFQEYIVFVLKKIMQCGHLLLHYRYKSSKTIADVAGILQPINLTKHSCFSLTGLVFFFFLLQVWLCVLGMCV